MIDVALLPRLGVSEAIDKYAKGEVSYGELEKLIFDLGYSTTNLFEMVMFIIPQKTKVNIMKHDEKTQELIDAVKYLKQSVVQFNQQYSPKLNHRVFQALDAIEPPVAKKREWWLWGGVAFDTYNDAWSQNTTSYRSTATEKYGEPIHVCEVEEPI